MSAHPIRPKKLLSLDNVFGREAAGRGPLSAGRQLTRQSDDGLGRREVIRAACASSLGLLCASLTGCAAGKTDAPATPLVPLPAPVQGRITLALGDFPQLKDVGGGLVGRASGMPDPIAVTHQEQGTFLAFTAVCSHMANTLTYNALNASLDCSRHGSSFELDGRVITGPATEPLRLIPTAFDGAMIAIITG
jgi:nitrite reductase/ring-hydroxylating ferredoxin subunit